MAKLVKLPSLAVINGFKGTIDFYLNMGIPCARSWPSSPGHDRAPAVEEQWPIFTTATRLWNELSQEVRDAYKQMASGLHLTGRDIFIKGYIKTLWLHLD